MAKIDNLRSVSSITRMPTALDPVRPIALDEIRAARQRIANTSIRTPLVRLELGADFPDIRLKLENLQPINAYKLRGAANAVAMLSEVRTQTRRVDDQRGKCRAGRCLCGAASGRAMHRRRHRDRAAAKIDRMRALGAKLIPVPYDVAWKALEERSFPGAEGTFVHPFDDHNFIAGHAHHRP